MNKIHLIFFLFTVIGLQAKQIEVCNSCEISTLKEAIEFAENGDKIFLKLLIY